MYKKMINLAIVLIFVALSVPTHQQNIPLSPCPGVFEYEATGSEQGRWDGVIHLSTVTPVSSVFLTVILDNKAELLGNWIGEVTTQDNIEFRIQTTDTSIHPEKPLDVKFYVKFNILNATPLIQKIKLNGRDICNADIPLPAVDRVTDIPVPPTIITVPPTTEPPPPPTPKPTPTPIPRPTLTTNSPPTLLPIQFETNPVSGRPIQPESPSPVFKKGPQPPVPVRVDGGTVENVPQNSAPTATKQNQCGTVLSGNPLVVSGTATLEGEWPWQIALYHTEYVDNKYVCGGTLVSHLHIITAAHCVTLKDSRQVGKTATYSVFLGKHNLMTSVRGVEFRYIRNIVVHSNYNPSPLNFDIAILEMQSRVEYSSWIQPACLWPENMIDLNTVIGQTGTVVGWGYNGQAATAVELLKVGMPVVEPFTCLQSFSSFFEKFISDYTYCAGFRNGSSACNGDSGGGMMFQIGDSWYLRGLVSLSVARRAEQLCNPSHYIVFTDVAKFLPWIKGIIYDL